MSSTRLRAAASRQFVRFLAAGVATVVVDFGLLAVFRSVVHLPLWLATTAAFACGLCVNFGLNQRWVFGVLTDARRRLFRYAVLVGLNYVATLLLVVGLTATGMPYLVAKVVAVGTCALLNFVAYREWVFA